MNRHIDALRVLPLGILAQAPDQAPAEKLVLRHGLGGLLGFCSATRLVAKDTIAAFVGRPVKKHAGSLQDKPQVVDFCRLHHAGAQREEFDASLAW